MPETPARPRLQPPPSRTVLLSQRHHEEGTEHHLGRIYSYACAMRATAGKGELPSLDHALQVGADLARLIAHLAALKELELLTASPAGGKRAA
jgi:hypothetical protein